MPSESYLRVLSRISPELLSKDHREFLLEFTAVAPGVPPGIESRNCQEVFFLFVKQLLLGFLFLRIPPAVRSGNVLIFLEFLYSYLLETLL